MAALRQGKFTQHQLAKRCKVSWINIARIETSKQRTSLKTLMAMLDKLDADEHAECTALSLWIQEVTGRNYKVTRNRH